METTTATDTKIVKIRAFRATDDFEACQKFIDGHRKVLDNHGIEKVTSSNNEWANNPSVFVILIESLDGTKTYGGARIHAVDGKYLLPIEAAIHEFDTKIFDIVKEQSVKGTGELCGLWNSKEVAGLGIGSFFSTIAGVVITPQIGVNSLFAFCAPPTVRFSQWVGCRVITSIGNNGTFYYPKIDLLATAVLLDDSINLPHADAAAREKMWALRSQLTQIVKDKAPIKRIEIEIHYHLTVASANANEFKLSRINLSSISHQ